MLLAKLAGVFGVRGDLSPQKFELRTEEQLGPAMFRSDGTGTLGEAT